jgi:hypothetical protein
MTDVKNAAQASIDLMNAFEHAPPPEEKIMTSKRSQHPDHK